MRGAAGCASSPTAICLPSLTVLSCLQEQEAEVEEQKVGSRSFSRKDEGPVPWLFNSLSQSCSDFSTTTQNFYPLAKFATHNRLLKLPKPIHFPPTLLLSQNYFKTGWSFNTYRRIRNVIITMDWIPDSSAQSLRLRQMHDMQYQPTLNEKQNELVGVAFRLFNLRGDHKLSPDEFRQFLSALDVYLTSEADLAEYIRAVDWNGDGIDLEDVKRMMRFQQYQRMQTGRYQVALTLHEAESVRGIMHMHTGSPILPLTSTAIALRVNAAGTVLDQSTSWYPAGEYQQTLEQQVRSQQDNSAKGVVAPALFSPHSFSSLSVARFLLLLLSAIVSWTVTCISRIVR
jgi:hypothetical protein